MVTVQGNSLHPYIVEMRRWRGIIGDLFAQHKARELKLTSVVHPTEAIHHGYLVAG